MRFGVLGTVTAWTVGGEAADVPGRKVRALLADLLTDPGRAVSADRLTEDLWGAEPPAKPANALQRKVSELRNALDAAEPGARELVAFRAPGYLLRVTPDGTDAGEFAAVMARARDADDPAARVRLVDDALALWRGPAFADVADEPFARAAITRLSEARLDALELRAEALIELGDHARALDGLAELADRHPARERLRAAQMRALDLSGRTVEALDVYARHRARLAETLGLDPAPDLVELHRAILRREPAPGPGGPPSRLARSYDQGDRVMRTNVQRGGVKRTAIEHDRLMRTNVPRGRMNRANEQHDRLRRTPVHGAAPPPLPRSATGLIGRDEAIEDVLRLLAGGRLVTLTGPGGVGKTSLALEAARRVEDSRDVYVAELAALPTGTTVDALAEAVLAVLRLGEHTAAGLLPSPGPVPSPERLARALRERGLLLVLDNCEHVVATAAALVARLLREAPGVGVLATSREPLAIAGEAQYPVPPLALPETGADIAHSPAVRLFTARVAATVPGFRLTEANAAAVAAICARLDGIPLALELAAPRVKVLGVDKLLDRLDDRFGLLTDGYRDAPARQRTLRAMIDWSYRLLGAAERTVLRRLSVHSGGCTLEAAEAVCGERDVDVLPVLSRLVDRSLVTVAHTGGEPRFRLLESVAAYAAERLAEAGETTRIRDRHAEYFTALAETAAPHLHGGGQGEWLARLDTESANLRAAAEHGTDPDRALRLVTSLAWYWTMRGRFGEADRLFALALGRARPNTVEHRRAGAWRWGLRRLRGIFGDEKRSADTQPMPDLSDMDARTLWFCAFALIETVDYATGAPLADRALDASRAARDDWGIAAALSLRAVLAFSAGDMSETVRDADESMRIFEGLGDAWGRLRAIYPLACIAEVTGDYGRAERLHAEGLAAAEDLELWRETSDRLCGLARIALLRGDLAASRRLHEDALNLALEHRHHGGEVSAEIGLGLTARRAGDLDRAEAHLRRVLEWGSEYDFLPIVTLMLAELGFVAELRGDPARALELHTRGLAEARRLDDARSIALALEGAAGALAASGDARAAARLLGTAAVLRESAGTPLPPGERGDVERIASRARSVLGDEVFAEELRKGRSLPAGPIRLSPSTMEVLDAG